MKTTLKTYNPDRDFLRIRQFLIDTFALYQRPFNWLIERWNFCRYFVVPMHTNYNIRYFGVPISPGQSYRDELPLWEKTIGIWENEVGDIVAVAHSENEEPGEAWIQIHPDYTLLYEEIVTYVEEHLAARADNLGYVKLYVNTGSELEHVAQARGYRRVGKGITHLEYTIGDLPAPELPNGFVIKSVAEEDNVEKRRFTKSVAFGGRYCPSDWTPAQPFMEIQRAPDYRKDLDLLLVAPNGDYAAFCTIWIDEHNRYGKFEPVGTHREYQRLGLGHALLTEGFRRMAQHGATRSFMESGNEFYRRIGFKETPYSLYPWIKYFPV